MFLTIFFERSSLFFKENMGFFLKGFFFVTPQIKKSNFNFFIANIEIVKCPLCGGSKVPPKIPIFFDIFFFKFINYDLTLPFPSTIYL